MNKAKGQLEKAERAGRRIQIEEFAAQRWALPVKFRPETCGFDTRVVALHTARDRSRELDLAVLATRIYEKLAA